jgi:hypothetical protein
MLRRRGQGEYVVRTDWLSSEIVMNNNIQQQQQQPLYISTYKGGDVEWLFLCPWRFLRVQEKGNQKPY